MEANPYAYEVIGWLCLLAAVVPFVIAGIAKARLQDKDTTRD